MADKNNTDKPKEVSPRAEAYAAIVATYAKERPASYKARVEAGEDFTKIPAEFTTEVVIDGKKTIKVWTAADE